MHLLVVLVLVYIVIDNFTKLIVMRRNVCCVFRSSNYGHESYWLPWMSFS